MPAQSKFIAVSRERVLALMFVLFASTMWTTQAHSQGDSNSCGHISNDYGPFDYRTQRDKLKIVEEYHLTPEVEALIKGHTGTIAADLAYTLHTSPNHHRALMAMVRLTEKLKDPQPRGMPFPVECYFDRAIRFVPDDTVVRILYAQFLTKRGRTSEALKQLEAAVFYAKDKAFSHYNIGLAYFDLKEYDKALAQAHKALELGFDRTELADQLKRVNKWQEPVNSDVPKTAN